MGRATRSVRAIVAVVLWLLSGIKVLAIAVEAGQAGFGVSAYVWFGVSLVFFSGLVFPRAVQKNIDYIRRKSISPIYLCYRPATWLLMLFMITLGLSLRGFELVSKDFIAGFYSGLGLSLVACVRFYIVPIQQFRREDKEENDR